jgi:hydrogenase expression/formation protein HypC
MCLAIPGKVIATSEQGGMRMGKVQFGGITREACLEYVPETEVGDYVLVHVGFAISRIDEAEAERTYEALRQLNQLTELESPVVEEIEPIKASDSIDSNASNDRLEPVLQPSELP